MNIAIYARYSSDNQRSESIDAQIRAINDYCSKNGYTPVKIYSDEAKSATTDARPEFIKMIEESALRLFDAVIVHKLDRFARNRYQSIIYREKLKNNGVKLMSVMENIDDSPSGVLLESMLEAYAEFYSINLANEVKKGLKENALKCKHTGGKPPFGYDVSKDLEYNINDVEAYAVRNMFRMYADGISYRDIIEWLNKNGFRTKYNTLFSKSALNNILKNEKYQGTFFYGKTKRVKINGKLANIKHSEENIIRVENGIPAIVSKELFEAVQLKMQTNKSRVRSFRAKEDYLLSGKLFCGICGTNMIGARRVRENTKTTIHYQCPNRKYKYACIKKEVHKNKIETLVIDKLSQDFFSEETINILAKYTYDEYRSFYIDIDNDILALRLKIKDLDRKIANIVDAISKGIYHESLTERMKKLDMEKIQINELILEKEKEIADAISFDDVKNIIKGISNLADLEFDLQKNIIDYVIRKIVVYDNLLKIKYSS